MSEISDETNDERIIFSGIKTYYINFSHVGESITALRKIGFYNFSLQVSITGTLSITGAFT